MPEDYSEKYADIINFKWPKPDKMGWMTKKNRAKIFLPFAALRGLEVGNEIKDDSEETIFVKGD